MATSSFWQAINPMVPQAATVTSGSADDVTTGALGQIGITSPGAVMHPDHPLFWFAGFAAVTLGLIGASTHLRVGPFRADVSAGKD